MCGYTTTSYLHQRETFDLHLRRVNQHARSPIEPWSLKRASRLWTQDRRFITTKPTAEPHGIVAVGEKELKGKDTGAERQQEARNEKAAMIERRPHY
ncbi:hypothetical protein VTL71DRAFT_6694 [Oculimacula yallundae]|uniref:Uncharacterized protein n=1 Tax=Oculimacula yallundae TaxID=86028 RepID=A0ABR4BXQ0_9HELO